MQYARQGTGILKNCEGKGAFGCLVSILLLGALLLFGERVGPPYFAYKGLEGDVRTEVSRAGAHFFSNDALIQNIMDVARKNEIRLKRESIKVERIAGQVRVEINYSVPVDLLVTQHVMEFSIKASSLIGAL